MGWSAVLARKATAPLAPMARSSWRNSSVVAVGKPLKLWATTSAVPPSARVNFSARPRGLASPTVSGMSGMPVKSEKRASTGRGPLENSTARVRLAASGLGSNTPSARTPLAWTARVWWSPKAVCRASTIWPGVGWLASSAMAADETAKSSAAAQAAVHGRNGFMISFLVRENAASVAEPTSRVLPKPITVDRRRAFHSTLKRRRISARIQCVRPRLAQKHRGDGAARFWREPWIG